MNNLDLVLRRYQTDQRNLNVCATVVFAVFSSAMLYFERGSSTLSVFASVIAFLWAYHWNSGRRIRNGAFAANNTLFSRIEHADLTRWLERRGPT
ncbi:MAG: hypothetical protein KBD06_05155, partial [Candidatus Pacebacteria bacterium]|nr:hypothetical protein [Candidatus Paceibacterota bacterium]